MPPPPRKSPARHLSIRQKTWAVPYSSLCSEDFAYFLFRLVSVESGASKERIFRPSCAIMSFFDGRRRVIPESALAFCPVLDEIVRNGETIGASGKRIEVSSSISTTNNILTLR